MPIWQPAVIVGGLIGDLGRYLLATCLVLGLGLLMGYRPAGGAGGAALAVALILVFAFSVSWIWTTLGLVLRSAQSVNALSLAIQFPWYSPAMSSSARRRCPAGCAPTST